MSNGIKIPGTFVPGTTSGVVVDSKYVKGGYMTVATQAERDELLRSGSQVLTPGTRIYVEADKKEYICLEHPVTGQKEFKDSFQETVANIEGEGFVKEEKVTEIVNDTAQSMVTEAVETVVPEMVDKKIDSKLETITEDITKQATEEAKKEAVKQVEQQIEQDYVKDEKLQSTVAPIQDDVNALQKESAATTEKVEANKAAIADTNSKVATVETNLADNYYTKSDIDGKISGVYHYKGSVATYDDLPKENLTVGDVYNVVATGMNYAWTADGWDELGTLFEADNYYNKEETAEEIDAKLTGYKTETIDPELAKKADKSELEDLASKSDLAAVEDAITYGEF